MYASKSGFVTPCRKTKQENLDDNAYSAQCVYVYTHQYSSLRQLESHAQLSIFNDFKHAIIDLIRSSQFLQVQLHSLYSSRRGAYLIQTQFVIYLICMLFHEEMFQRAIHLLFDLHQEF